MQLVTTILDGTDIENNERMAKKKKNSDSKEMVLRCHDEGTVVNQEE